MSAERTVYVVELANVIIFALGIVSQALAVYTLFAAKRYRDAAKALVDSSKVWAESARNLKEAAHLLLAENERRYGVRATPPAETGKPS
jgi:hypothetical protein